MIVVDIPLHPLSSEGPEVNMVDIPHRPLRSKGPEVNMVYIPHRAHSPQQELRGGLVLQFGGLNQTPWVHWQLYSAD